MLTLRLRCDKSANNESVTNIQIRIFAMNSLFVDFFMSKFILGKKISMSQIFDEKGNVVPVTLIEAGPCAVTQVKTKEKDGYEKGIFRPSAKSRGQY